jgi:superfamily II DNA or RNA helicase
LEADIRSGWLKRTHPDRPGRVLFLADRVVLRDQAYKAFAPFATEGSDPRHLIQNAGPNLHRDLYFGIYQTLWLEGDDGRRTFERFPRDFFDLVVIDEAHRSGFGTWREILDHFTSAVHLGMTATPRQSDNVDTYGYFCADEPEVPVREDDPTSGTRRPAAYEYSLGRGIEDGFLATYKVHRVRTTIDQAGLKMQEAVEQGAEVFVPEGAAPREEYHTPQFEREISLPDRTRAMVDHLAGLLRRFGPTERTMVFCVDIPHAQLVARLLNDAFGHLGLQPYAVPIVAEEAGALTWLRQFQDSDRKTPVVATTAELLSTGVDVPSCRNIVFMKTLSSPVLFKQIIGRGSRVDPATDKLWFRVIDYTGATRLFDEWDRPQGPPPERVTGPQTATVEGKVVTAEESAAPGGGAANGAAAGDLIAFIHGTLLPGLQALTGSPLADTVRAIFSERTVIVAASGYNLKDVLAIINEIDFTSQDDIFTVGQVYEDLLRKLGNENKMAGEFYTPRPVIRFVVDLVAPQLGETVYDPAMGSGGFLAESFGYMLKANTSRTIEQDELLQTRTFWATRRKRCPRCWG